MTIRSGGRPRDRRATNARPYDPDAYATETIPEYSEPIPRSRGGGNGGRGGNGLVGFLKFLVFALVLAVIVLAVALTVLRPVVGDAVMSVAEDNPAALQLPFVKDIVAENLGPALTEPVSTEPTQVQFLVEKGDTAKTIAMKLEDEGLIGDSRAFVYLAVVERSDTRPPAGNVRPAQEHDAGSGGERAAWLRPTSSTSISACGPACAWSRSPPSSSPSIPSCRWTPRSSTTS